MSINDIGDSKNILRKDGYYYMIKEYDTNPYFINEYGGYSKDTANKFKQINISTLALYKDGSAMKLGTFSGMQDNLAFNFNIKCNLDDHNTLESAFEHFECFIKNNQDKGLNFLNAKAEIWNQGVYKIIDNEITLQIFYNSMGNYFLYEEKGKILNDSTFVLENARDFQNGKDFRINKVFVLRRDDKFPYIPNYILKNKNDFKNNRN